MPELTDGQPDAAYDAMATRRAEWEQEGGAMTNAFVFFARVHVRGAASSCDDDSALTAGEAAKGMPIHFCRMYTLVMTSSFSHGLYGAHAATMLALLRSRKMHALCDRRQSYYRMTYVLTEEDLSSFVPYESFAN